HLFDIPDSITYLNCAYLSPDLKAVTAAGRAALERTAHPWSIAVPDFFDTGEEIRSLVASLLDGDADGVALVPSASYGIGVATNNIEVRPGQRIVVLAEEFPSNYYPWREVGEVTAVPRPSGGDSWTDAVLSQIDDRAAVVAVPHCHWTDGTTLDLDAVGARS